jgi:hypothetical protein
VDQFKIHKLALQISRSYFNRGYGVELGTRNAVKELLALAPWLSPWEIGKVVDRVWTALERSETMKKLREYYD